MDAPMSVSKKYSRKELSYNQRYKKENITMIVLKYCNVIVCIRNR